MKSLISLLLLFSPLFLYAVEERPGLRGVIVKVLDKSLPAEETQRDKFLWDSLANQPAEQKLNGYSADKWKENFALFAKELLRKADEQKLDSASLRKVLDLVLKDSKDEIAYLPIGAYQTSSNAGPVWIIAVKWEYAGIGANGLGHIRMFAFEQKTLEQVGFVTCN